MSRIDKINDELKRALSELLRSVKDPRISISGIVSVTRVEATPDLKHAKVYVSVLPEESAEGVLRGLASAAGYLRRELSKQLTVHQTPELRFIGDTSIAYGAHISELLSDINAEATDSENSDNDD